ncbi:MAG: metal-dependent hydrolase [Nannocystaceae bacterium]|nr:metal-dependent hydrolase [Myxococcales bacterium]
MTATATRHAVHPRVMDFELDETIPRHWHAGLAMPTAISNTLHLLFPLGERFFVRSVKHYFQQIEDPELRAQVKGFFGQEGRHAREHERFFEVLEAQGYEVRRFLRFYDKLAYGFLERLFSPQLRLSVTVALEHYTAIMAENAFVHGLLDEVDPRVRALLLWHAAEEIEHKAVAFDVLKQVNPSYWLRARGMALATLAFVAFWISGTIMFLRQEPDVNGRELLRQLGQMRRRHPIVRRVFLRGIREYLRRDFHPWDNDNHQLAARYLEGVAARA